MRVLVLGLLLLGCGHDVTIERPTAGRALESGEESELQRVADTAFRDAKGQLEGLPPKLTLIVRFGEVAPETGANGAAGYPGNVSLTLDATRDVLATIRSQVRATLLHELHHLARASRIRTVTLRDRIVTEGLATAFERDVAKVMLPWGEPPPEDWIEEVLRQPDDAATEDWLFRHPDGRRWTGMRVGTALVDRAARASGKSAAGLVFAPTEEVLRSAGAPRGR